MSSISSKRARNGGPATARTGSDSGPEGSGEALAGRAGQGCESAFEQLVRRYEAPVFRYLAGRTGDRDQAMDLTQETFVKVHQGLARYDPSRPFAPWLFAIARHVGIDALRARRDETGERLESAGIDRRDPSVVLGERERGRLLWALAREALPEAQYTALWLHYAEDMSVKEIAAAMQRSAVSVKVMLHRGRRALEPLVRGADLDTGPDGTAGGTT